MSGMTCVTKVQVEVVSLMLFNVMLTALGLGEVEREVKDAIRDQTNEFYSIAC